jgi:hypothetical protein
MLVVEVDREVLLTLESQGLLCAGLRARREYEGGNASGSRQRGGRSCEIRRLDIVDINIGDFDGLGLELSAEAGTVESSTCGRACEHMIWQMMRAHTENRGFIGVDVQCNLLTGNLSEVS